jgi:geranylgeranyl diphosphate synthase type II
MKSDSDTKLNDVLSIFQECKVDEWAKELKNKYLGEAFNHLNQISVDTSRKEPLKELAFYLVEREH